MNKTRSPLRVSLLILVFTMVVNINLSATQRKAYFNSNWKFHSGNVANVELSEYNEEGTDIDNQSEKYK